MREFSNSRAVMTVETVDSKWHVVHMNSGCSLDLMKQVFSEYKCCHLFACVTLDSKVNKVASLFGDLVMQKDGVNIYHIKGD